MHISSVFSFSFDYFRHLLNYLCILLECSALSWRPFSAFLYFVFDKIQAFFSDVSVHACWQESTALNDWSLYVDVLMGSQALLRPVSLSLSFNEILQPACVTLPCCNRGLMRNKGVLMALSMGHTPPTPLFPSVSSLSVSLFLSLSPFTLLVPIWWRGIVRAE